MANTAELQRVLDDITADVTLWNQGFWVTPAEETIKAWDSEGHNKLVPTCGTSYCAAGHVVTHHGYRFIARWDLSDTTAIITADQVKQLEKTGSFDGWVTNVEQVAGELLELGFEDADAFFSATNELIDLWALAWAYTNGGLTLPEGGIPAVAADEDQGRYAQPAYKSAAAMRFEMDERLRNYTGHLDSLDAYLGRTAEVSVRY